LLKSLKFVRQIFQTSAYAPFGTLCRKIGFHKNAGAMWKDAKYLIAYLLPLSAFAGIWLGGPFSFGSIYVGFLFIPILEQLLPRSVANLSPAEEDTQSKRRLFDVLLYLNIPILYSLIGYYFHTLAQGGLAGYEVLGLTLNVGLLVGSIGINVGHELGHRSARYEQRMAKALLLPALYMHFIIEHNRGHHKNVATDADPASARRGQTLYAFWLQSVIGGYRHAWQLERERLAREGRPFFSASNEMLHFSLLQLLWLLAVGAVFGWALIPFAIAIATVGILMLETVNYIEHYGLRRRRLESGAYEIVQPHHSWNSDHELGRIFLYELTRHSDHHYKASRKYQVLRHFDESPQLPLGYPASILMALVPPLWFVAMNPLVDGVAGDN
jgi:alkane 1-monooxygenase